MKQIGSTNMLRMIQRRRRHGLSCYRWMMSGGRSRTGSTTTTSSSNSSSCFCCCCDTVSNPMIDPDRIRVTTAVLNNYMSVIIDYCRTLVLLLLLLLIQHQMTVASGFVVSPMLLLTSPSTILPPVILPFRQPVVQSQQRYPNTDDANYYSLDDTIRRLDSTTTTTTVTTTTTDSVKYDDVVDDIDEDTTTTTTSTDIDIDMEMDTIGDSTLVTSMTFRERYSDRLPEWLLNQCMDTCDYIYPTRIQAAVLDAVLRPETSSSSTVSSTSTDMIVQSETGSGKTLAFLLPAIASIDPHRSVVQVLIVVPTRELGLQIARIAKRLTSASSASTSVSSSSSSSANSDGSNSNLPNIRKKIMIMSVLQGSQNRRQRAWAWAEPPHMIIGTPTELCMMIRNGGIKRYNSIKYLIVDEVDACLLQQSGHNNNNNNNNNKHGSGSSLQFTGTPLHELLSKYLSPTYDDGTEAIAMAADSSSSIASFGSSSSMSSQRPILPSRTTIFCSATIPQHRYFAKQCVQNQWMLHTPTYISLRVGSQHLPSQLQHSYTVTSEESKKLATLRRMIKQLMTTCRATNTPKRVLVFSDTHRPLEEMAKVIAKDIHGFYYTEQTMSGWKSSPSSKSSTTMEDHQALTSVLRYEHSLSQRAVAMDVLRSSDDNFHTLLKRSDDDDEIDDDSDEMYSSSSSSAHHHRYRHPNNNNNINKGNSSTILLRVLLSTDLAARGLDIVDITHVIQMDLPNSVDMYVHRAGRTGRLNRSGQVTTIITSEQEFVLRRIMNQLQVDILPA